MAYYIYVPMRCTENLRDEDTAMNHSTSKRTAKSLPQVESTVSLSITAKIMKFTARQDFTVGNCQIRKGETCFAVQSERRPGRFYIVRFCEARATYLCSCGAGCHEHEHLSTVREYVMSHVVVPAKSSEVIPMTVPATVAQVKAARKAKAEQTTEQYDGSRPLTAAEWKKIAKADRKRQKAWA